MLHARIPICRSKYVQSCSFANTNNRGGNNTLLFQKMREGHNGLSYCVRVKELVRANMSKNVVVVCVWWWWGGPVRGRLNVSSVAGDVFCLVTAGRTTGQSDQHVRFERGGPSCLLLSRTEFRLLFFLDQKL